MSTPPPSSESKFVAKAANVLIRWTPVGGGVGLLAHFLFKQDWFLVALMFPVMLVTGAWAAYTENFIETFSLSAGERGKSDAKSFAGWLKQGSEKLQRRFTGADNQFRLAQAEACGDYETEGLSEARWSATPQLEEVYVPLALTGRLQRGEVFAEFMRRSGGEAAKEETQYIWNLLRMAKDRPSYRRIAIIARGGFGKTTLLRHITYRYGIAPHRVCREKLVPRLIPVLLLLREWRKEMAKAQGPTLPELMVQYAQNLPGQLKSLDLAWANSLLSSGKALVMIDGFDEVAADQCEAVSAWINKAVRDYGKTTLFILTSRPNGYDRYETQQAWMPVDVQEFSDKQRNDFLRRWYCCKLRGARLGKETDAVKDKAEKAAAGLIEQIDRRAELKKMATNPLLLCMIATYHQLHPTRDLPIERPKLYQKFCQMLLEDRPVSKGIQMVLPAEEGQLLLQSVALEMVQQDCIAVPKAEMVQRVDRALARYEGFAMGQSQIPVDKFVQQIEEVSELFVRKHSSEEYEFAHRSFQEYLAAVEVKRQQQESLLLALKPEWRDTAVLYAALVLNPTSLIEQLCDQSAEAQSPEQARTILALAYDCWLENNRVEKDATFMRMQSLCYTELENCMIAGDWREADGYTHRLMIQVLGKRYTQGFTDITANELLMFPCNDLLRIDGLWVLHSQGRFGFSVQKKIYVACGGPLDGKYHEQPYAHFFHAVGWCKEGAIRYDSFVKIFVADAYREYDDLIFSLEKGVEGHFPSECLTKRFMELCLFSHPAL